MNISKIIIRNYEQRDLEEIRQLACDTMDRGSPIPAFFLNRELIADFLISYYNKYEPRSLWVAEYEGHVAGYLTGCLDSRMYFLKMLFFIVPGVIFKAIFRGMARVRGLLEMFFVCTKSLVSGDFSARFNLKGYPAHLHIKIKHGFRGMNIGNGLMERFLEEARREKARGIHLGVREDNVAGQRFFEKAGFRKIGRYPALLPGRRFFERKHILIYSIEI